MSGNSLIPPVSVPNLQEQSVSQVANAVKRTVEQAFDRVRIRGEISRPTYARSGHLYLTLKDEKAVLDAVAWKGKVASFSIRAEEGMEVVAEGRLTTYPGSSKYQLVMDRMELAGEGALLKLLEDRKRKLAAEGLFVEDKKQSLPFMPRTIGVVTSPTGAVIRDILHRLNARFPVRVLIWPVQVQGRGAETKIADAIKGFNALPANGDVPRPDVLIVARGGGSLEDLWCFNEEAVARAAAASEIPLISAIGHETDTTLIDFASDVRAPTPTAAAEMSVPVRDHMVAYLEEMESRGRSAIRRVVTERAQVLEGLARGLVNPERALENLTQRLDETSQRLDIALKRNIHTADQNLKDLITRLPNALKHQWARAQQRFSSLESAVRMQTATQRILQEKTRGLDASFAKLKSFELAETKALERGYARIWDSQGQLIQSANDLPSDQVTIEFHDGKRAFPAAPATSAPPRSKAKKPNPPKDQGSLF